MNVYISNAFSLSMLPPADWNFLAINDVEPENIPAHWLKKAISAVGHQSTADIFGAILGRPVACNRQSISLEHGDKLIVGQYSGPRLPEGATSLPEGAKIRWLIVRYSP